MVYLFIFLFGVGFGGTVPLMPAIRAEYFGRAALGKIQGFMNPVMMFAGAVGPIFAGYVFDTTGAYRISFLVTGLLTFCAVDRHVLRAAGEAARGSRRAGGVKGAGSG